MQCQPELVPIIEYLRKASESSGKLLHFEKIGIIPKKFGKILTKIQQNCGKFCQQSEKNLASLSWSWVDNRRARVKSLGRRGSSVGSFPCSPDVERAFSVELAAPADSELAIEVSPEHD